MGRDTAKSDGNHIIIIILLCDNFPGQYIDKDLVRTLRWLKDNGHFENTLLIVMGDHGARYSKVRW